MPLLFWCTTVRKFTITVAGIQPPPSDYPIASGRKHQRRGSRSPVGGGPQRRDILDSVVSGKGAQRASDQQAAAGGAGVADTVGRVLDDDQRRQLARETHLHQPPLEGAVALAVEIAQQPPRLP